MERKPRRSGQREERAVCTWGGLEDVGVDSLECGEEGAEEGEEEAEERKVVVAVGAARVSVGERNGWADNVREGDAGHDGDKREDLESSELRAEEKHGKGGRENGSSSANDLMKLRGVSRREWA